jgi:hypothetical protein
MRTIDRARRQYGLSEDQEIPEYMSLGDPPPYQSPDDYAPSPAPIPSQQRDTIMAQPVIDSGVVVAGDDRALPYSVYRELMLKQDELQSNLDLCISWADMRRKKDRPITKKGLDGPWTLAELNEGRAVDAVMRPTTGLVSKKDILIWLKDNASDELLEQFGIAGPFRSSMKKNAFSHLVDAYAAAIKGGGPKLKEKMVGGSKKKKNKTRRKSKKKKTRRKSKKKKTRRKSKKSRNKRSK